MRDVQEKKERKKRKIHRKTSQDYAKLEQDVQSQIKEKNIEAPEDSKRSRKNTLIDRWLQ